MFTEEIAENIYRIPVPLPKNPLKELNSYLIKDAERSLLIDTGFRLDACREALLKGLGELGEDPGSVDIFLTHMHADHAGLAADIAGEGARIFVSETDCARLNNSDAEDEKYIKRLADRNRTADLPAFIIDNMKRINPALAYSPNTEFAAYSTVSGGETLRVGGYALRCILTPGHSPGHMCLWDETTGIMFTGDHILFDITPNITAWPFVEDSLADYISSLRQISAYPVKLALPGHRKTGDFHARVDELLTHHQVRLGEVERLVHELPGSTAYEITGRMRWNIRASTWEDFPPPQKIFAVGECLSHIDYLLRRERIVFKRDGAVKRYYCHGSGPYLLGEKC